jgi:hypothetical protein
MGCKRKGKIRENIKKIGIFNRLFHLENIMDFSSTGSIMYCRTCKEYMVINVDEKNPKNYKCSRCQVELLPVLDS